jgi:hypothetical protein
MEGAGYPVFAVVSGSWFRFLATILAVPDDVQGRLFVVTPRFSSREPRGQTHQ